MNRKEIIAKVAEVAQLANKRFPRLQMPTPTVDFYNKGRAAGWANWVQHTVKFNEILANENAETFHETIIHEIAHLVTKRMYPRAKQAHGPEFKYVDQMLGGRGTRCHSYDVSSVSTPKRKTRYEVVCKCVGTSHWVTKALADKTTDPYRRITCKTCGALVAKTGKSKVFI